MSARFDHIDDYLQQYTQREKDFFTPWREAAATQLQTFGFPGLKTESWKYTNSKPLLQTCYSIANQASITRQQIAPHLLKNAYHLVLLNGYIDLSLSTLPQNISRDISSNIFIGSILQASIEHPDALSTALAKSSLKNEPGFTALNTLLFMDGYFVYLQSNTQLDKPLHILQFTDVAESSVALHGRNLIVLEANANAIIIEQYLSNNEHQYWRNVASQMTLASGATLQYYQIQQESLQAFQTDFVDVQQQRDSQFTHFTLDMGGQLVRHDIKDTLLELGAHCQLNGLYLTRAAQHIDNHTDITHASSTTFSDEYYKGIIADTSHAVFNGRILVEKGIAKIESKQRNHNLLLSDLAEIDTKPELEIYADDVKCSHGATIGKLDEAALFYLMSRGIESDAAKQLLIYGFAQEVIEKIQEPAIGHFITSLLTRWFINDDKLKELL